MKAMNWSIWIASINKRCLFDTYVTNVLIIVKQFDQTYFNVFTESSFILTKMHAHLQKRMVFDVSKFNFKDGLHIVQQWELK
jgi:hypothetical protein